MDDGCPPEKKKDEGAPAWVMTFADLMSLLMCFFVLLLSFSEMDVAKYKQIAGSMREAFGVQRKHKVKEPPKGINIIAQEFSAGRPDPTPFNIVEQMTTDTMKQFLDTGDRRRKSHDGKQGRKGGGSRPESGHDGLEKGAQKQQGQEEITREELVMMPKADAMELLKARKAAEQRKRLQKTAEQIRKALRAEIKSGAVEVESTDKRIIIRIREKASFPSGSAYLRESFRPILLRVGEILKGVDGKLVVSGHSDNIPIFTERYRSNWELSAARAVSVVHELIDEAGIQPQRISIEGRADTQPLVPNDSPANRAKNRRVEILFVQGDDLETANELPLSGVEATPGLGAAPRQPGQMVDEDPFVAAPPVAGTKSAGVP
ncbi:type VI secretion system protein TssL, long form [Thiohalobacter sp. IOR34]|uniref:type VI secretion system protein TssL, long form n=1 Tax=Thiohalobacter sp. IOR34 TaxID=3057176 RepID=UPI0025B038C8|nr:type VI secretion system protein TssL, long form [Thiohalobacter sp. IOR34]WJW74970.1 type VI secretion system protein TssL, long form [Thiohalobacter sp. IOR34]